MIQFIKKLFGIPKIDFKELVKKDALIIDVRTPQEYNSDHLKNAINIPLQVLSSKINSLNKHTPIITICASGIRSSNAKSILKSAGFEVYNGGAWLHLQKYLSAS